MARPLQSCRLCGPNKLRSSLQGFGVHEWALARDVGGARGERATSAGWHALGLGGPAKIQEVTLMRPIHGNL